MSDRRGTSGADATAPGSRGPRRRAALAVAAMLQGGITLWAAANPPEMSELLVLRWFRTIAEHPLRCGLAFVLLAVACGVGGRADAEP